MLPLRLGCGTRAFTVPLGAVLQLPGYRLAQDCQLRGTLFPCRRGGGLRTTRLGFGLPISAIVDLGLTPPPSGAATHLCAGRLPYARVDADYTVCVSLYCVYLGIAGWEC